MLESVISNQTLAFLGLSRFHFNVIILIILILSLLAFIVFIQKLGIFRTVEFDIQKMRECRIVYCNHQGNYQKIGNVFNRLKEIFGKHFKISKMFGIYYDNPAQLVNKNMGRSTIGIIVNQGQLYKVSQFFQQNPSFKTTILPAAKFISTRHPFINELSFFLLPLKVYPKLMAYIDNMKLNLAECPVIMQVYHFLSRSGKEIQVRCVLQNRERFMLWEDDQDLIVDRRNNLRFQ